MKSASNDRDYMAEEYLTTMNKKYDEIEQANMPNILSEEALKGDE